MAKHKDKPMPGERHLIELSIAATRHARGQLHDAQDLLALGRWSMALVVAALGLEEMGKAYLCISALSIPAEVRERENESFWAKFNSHTAKAALGQLPLATYLSVTPPNLETAFADIEAAGAKVNDAKFKGLYVDLADGGELSEPDAVAESDACAVVAMLTHALDDALALGLSFEDVADPAEVIEFLDWWKQNGDVHAMHHEAQSEADVARMLAEARALLRGEGPVPAWIHMAFPGLIPDQGAAAALQGFLASRTETGK